MTEIKFLRKVNDGSYYYDGWNQALDRLEQFLETIEPVSKEKLIDEASDWLDENIYDFYDGEDEFGKCSQGRTSYEFIKDFNKYMKRE